MYIYDEAMDTTGCPHADIQLYDDGPAHTIAVCNDCNSDGPVIEALWNERYEASKKKGS